MEEAAETIRTALLRGEVEVDVVEVRNHLDRMSRSGRSFPFVSTCVLLAQCAFERRRQCAVDVSLSHVNKTRSAIARG